MILMRDFIHGFHSMDNNLGGVAEYRRATNMTIELFKELFEEINGHLSAET